MRAQRRRGALQRLQQREPVAGRVGGEHRAGAVDDGRHVEPVQRRPNHLCLAVGAHEHREMAGADSLGPGHRPGVVALLERGLRGEE